MKLLVQSAMIFFGTLMAAGLVALGEPADWHSGQAERDLLQQLPGLHALDRWMESGRTWTAQWPLTGWHE